MRQTGWRGEEEKKRREVDREIDKKLG